MYVCIPKIRFESKPYLLIYFPFLDHVKNMYVCPEEESILTSSFVSTLSALSIKQGDLPPQTHTCSINTIRVVFTSIPASKKKFLQTKYCSIRKWLYWPIILVNICTTVQNKEVFDFRALRLDWLRLQVFWESTPNQTPTNDDSVKSETVSGRGTIGPLLSPTLMGGTYEGVKETLRKTLTTSCTDIASYKNVWHYVPFSVS